KKSEFKHLPYPPVEMLDIIGNQLELDETYHFKKRDAKKLKTVLLDVKKRGTLPGILRHLPSIVGLLLKYHLSIDSITALFGKYCSSWGEKQTSYRFDGYKDSQKVISNAKGAIFEKKLWVAADSGKLVEDATYDVTRIVVKCTNQNDNVLPYDNSVVTVKTNGVVDIIGADTFALVGGQRAVWVKTNGKSGKAVVTIESEGREQVVELDVEKK
ncbi:MAG: glycoside hydrolase family 2 protein, partial [Clostridia bacterium]